MTNEQNTKRNPWQFINAFFKRKYTILQIGANLAGSGIVTFYFMFLYQGLAVPDAKKNLIVIGIMFVGLVIIGYVFLSRWQRDLDRFVDLKMHNQAVDLDLLKKVQRKILNLPYICSLTSLFNWFLAAIIMTIYSSIDLIEGSFAVKYFHGSRIFIGVIIAGIVTCAIIFFSIEKSCTKIWPHFFPDGGLIKTSAVFRLRLHVRMLVIFGLSSVMPIILMAVLSYNKARMMLVLPPQDVIGSLLYLTAFLLVVALATVIFLSRTFSKSIIAPVRRMENAMVKVEAGDFTAFVPVDTNDELGALAEHFNQMTEGLKERYQLRRSLDLAKEVQQNLLPKANPVVEGLDIAGKSIYCDETGGDYYDFISIGDNDKHKIGVAIGDVSGHGISSALLMAAVRSSLRQRSSLPGGISGIMSDVNRQLVQDVEDSGQFITMFYLTIDPIERQLQWVRAGHDPAIFYDPGSDTFEELAGSGIALGVNEDWIFKEFTKADLHKGQIIFLSTDGIWEARNDKGEMFGKEPIYNIIRNNSSLSANEILEIIFESLNSFQKGFKVEDDITLLIIKITY
ncbi:MAG: SpoIIE family protein phosphatase [Desulfobacterales bacterium]|nr:MAG: SpoIIE family protein phosphatase [Desulfobacterales bacterium]